MIVSKFFCEEHAGVSSIARIEQLILLNLLRKLGHGTAIADDWLGTICCTHASQVALRILRSSELAAPKATPSTGTSDDFEGYRSAKGVCLSLCFTAPVKCFLISVALDHNWLITSPALCVYHSCVPYWCEDH